MKALLFSGGVDSTCIAWSERPERLVFVDYGQIPAKGELRACSAIARELELPLRVLTIDLRAIGTGTMAGNGVAITGAPAEFWPFRNQMLITLAAMAFADDSIDELLVGTVATDRQHPDGRPEFLAAAATLLCVQAPLTLRAPASGLTTDQLMIQSGAPADLLHWTFSCHTGEWACGRCNGCQKRAEAMATLPR